MPGAARLDCPGDLRRGVFRAAAIGERRAMESVFVPAVRAMLPEDWYAKESITLLAPDGAANVIASSEPVEAEIAPHTYATVQGDLLRSEFPKYEELEFGPKLILRGRPGYMRVFSWVPEDGVPIVQMQLYYAEAGRGYTATATTPSSEFGRYEQQLRACLEGIFLDTSP